MAMADMASYPEKVVNRNQPRSLRRIQSGSVSHRSAILLNSGDREHLPDDTDTGDNITRFTPLLDRIRKSWTFQRSEHWWYCDLLSLPWSSTSAGSEHAGAYGGIGTSRPTSCTEESGTERQSKSLAAAQASSVVDTERPPWLKNCCVTSVGTTVRTGFDGLEASAGVNDSCRDATEVVLGCAVYLPYLLLWG